MISETFPAMGTSVQAWSDSETGLRRTRAWFAEVEASATRFSAWSELSRLNDDPTNPTVVSPLLARILGAAWMVRDLTDGLVDPAVGDDVIRWGYDRTFDDLGRAAVPTAPASRGVWDIDARLVRRTEGTRLDLGGVAKGWAADAAVEAGYASVVSAGGDIRSAHPDTEVRILGPDEDVVAVVGLGRRALATSSTARRTWETTDGRAHHLIDPRTGDPARSPVVSASAVTATAALAEGAAKAILIHGVDGLAWADAQPWIDGAVVVWEDGSVYATAELEVVA